MEFRHTLEILHNQADEISSITERLKSGKELRNIELDLLLEKLRNIYDLVRDLQGAATSTPAAVSDDRHVRQEGEQVKASMPPVQKTAQPDVDRSTPQGNKEKKGEAKDVASVSDQYKASGRILAEEMSEKAKSGDISSRILKKPISSLSGAIGLAEKFELINELFHGSRDSFDKAVNVLDMARTFEEARDYMEENFKWDMNNPYVQRILELLQRKLTTRQS